MLEIMKCSCKSKMNNSMKVCIKILKMLCLNKQPFMNSVNTKTGHTTGGECWSCVPQGKRAWGLVHQWRCWSLKEVERASFREDDPGSGAHFLGSNSASTCCH